MGFCLKVFNDELIVGGGFTEAGGMPCSRIARWNGNEWLSFDAEVVGPYVFAIGEYNGDLIVGGHFTAIGSVPASYIARWDGSMWSVIGDGLDSIVGDLCRHNGDLIAVGQFSEAGGSVVNGIARWDGDVWHSVGNGADHWVNTAAEHNGDLYIGGYFSFVDSLACNRIAHWDGYEWHALEPGANNTVWSLTSYNGELIVGGDFDSIGGIGANGIASWDENMWRAMGSGVSPPGVSGFAVHSDSLLVGGGFLDAGGTECNRVAIWHYPGLYVSTILIEGQSDPSNIVDHCPTFAWEYHDPSDSHPQAAYEIEVGSDDDWSQAEEWASGQIESPDTFAVYSGSSLIDGRTYFFRLRLANDTVWSPWYQTSFRMNTPPTVPTTLRPIDGEVATTNPPVLWIQNSTDADGDTLVYDFWGIKDTSCPGKQVPIEGYNIPEGEDSTHFIPESPLSENCLYWWQARAYDGYEYSDWTFLFAGAFIVDGIPQPPTVPDPIYPPDTSGLPVFDMTPEFTWVPSWDPDPYDSVWYRLVIALDSNFTFVNTIDSIAGSPYELTDSLNFDTRYWWRVRAFDKTGLSTLSEFSKDFWTWTLGDLDHNHSVDIADLVYLVSYMFQSGQAPYPLYIADINGDCVGPDISDLIYLVTYMFNGGPPPGVCSRH
mgnify:CR=1 FL=1